MLGTNTSLFLGTPKKALGIIGTWMWSKHNLFWKMYTIFVFFTQYSFVAAEIAFIAEVWGDMDAVSEASYLLFSQASVCYKSTTFMINEKYLVMLINMMESEMFQPQYKKHERIISMLSRRIKWLGLFLYTSSITTTTLWGMMPLFDKAGPRSFPFRIWMPISPEQSPGYELGYLCQMVTIYIGALLFVGVDYVAISSIMFGCAQLDIVMEKLEQVKSVPAPGAMDRVLREELLKSNNQLLIDCIRRHQAVVRFIEIVENMFHANIFFQLMGTVAIICNIALRITLVENGSVQFYSMLNFMLTMISQLFFWCWIGHELTIRSEELRDWLYQCPWYDQDMKYRRAMCITMERLKNPIIFKAGHYVALSRATFVSILRCSYSYFAVLNQRTEAN